MGCSVCGNPAGGGERVAALAELLELEEILHRAIEGGRLYYNDYGYGTPEELNVLQRLHAAAERVRHDHE
ncbi:MAG: hypothetical protein ABS79_00250 [Planctomycetes bacterium SCN 63-9]|nr:MAG: hypothetical protein ABS79_00250 [Planctomycetes bacterium SCN 63-9]